jgi:hypothetical protein
VPAPNDPKRRNRRAETTLVLSLAAAGAACEPPAPAASSAPVTVVVPALSAPVPSASASASAAPEEPAPPKIDLAARALDLLRPQAVHHGKPGRATLYTWTTREQVDEIAAKRVLLTRSESPQKGPAFVSQDLAERAKAQDQNAMLLRTEAFARLRFAWTAPWATLMGWPEESYGDELIQITLKPNAWIARVLTHYSAVEVVDLDGNPVSIAEVKQHPERLAAIYFANSGQSYAGGTYAVSTGRPAYREYVICNESMVERWAVGTEEIARVIQDEIAALEAYRAHLAQQPQRNVDIVEFGKRVVRQWNNPNPPPDPDAAYAGALAFPNTSYLPEERAIAAILERLKALPRPRVTLEHRPTVTFSRAATQRRLPAPKPAPPPPRLRNGTF